MPELTATKEAVFLLGCSPPTFNGYLGRRSLFPTKKSGSKNFFDKWRVSFRDTNSADIHIGIYIERAIAFINKEGRI